MRREAFRGTKVLTQIALSHVLCTLAALATNFVADRADQLPADSLFARFLFLLHNLLPDDLLVLRSPAIIQSVLTGELAYLRLRVGRISLSSEATEVHRVSLSLQDIRVSYCRFDVFAHATSR